VSAPPIELLLLPVVWGVVVLGLALVLLRIERHRARRIRGGPVRSADRPTDEAAQSRTGEDEVRDRERREERGGRHRLDAWRERRA
jgi:hypothetical protein